MAAYPPFNGNEPCREMDPDIYFPPTWLNFNARTRAVMDEACNSCHVRDACLMWALYHEREGYWAGTTPMDRTRMRRHMRISVDVPGIDWAERRDQVA